MATSSPSTIVNAYRTPILIKEDRVCLIMAINVIVHYNAAILGLSVTQNRTGNVHSRQKVLDCVVTQPPTILHLRSLHCGLFRSLLCGLLRSLLFENLCKLQASTVPDVLLLSQLANQPRDRAHRALVVTPPAILRSNQLRIPHHFPAVLIRPRSQPRHRSSRLPSSQPQDPLASPAVVRL